MSSLLSPDKKTSEAELEGLDKLQTDTARSGADRKKQLKRTLTRVLSPLAAVVVLILIWQLYVWLGGKRQDVVPGPLDVAATFGQLWEQGTLQQAVWTSVQRGLIGFVVSAVIGTALGLLFAQVRPLRTASAR